MPKSFSYKSRFLYFCLFVLIFLIGFPILVFYSAGYTWDSFGLSARGGIYVFTPEPNTSVFVGNELQNVSGFFNKEILLNDLKPAQYLVLATNEEFWPWSKFVDVKKGEVQALTPFMVPKVIETEIVTTADPVRRPVVALFATTTNASAIQSTSTPGALIRRDVKIWSHDTKLFAQWQGSEDAAPEYFCVSGTCIEPIQVFEGFVPIRSIDFYPGRADAIILALDTGIYAVEIDRRPNQNFYPLYHGETPDFRVYRGQVYIKDSNYIALLNL
jgi:hypothetical protein